MQAKLKSEELAVFGLQNLPRCLPVPPCMLPDGVLKGPELVLLPCTP